MIIFPMCMFAVIVVILILMNVDMSGQLKNSLAAGKKFEEDNTQLRSTLNSVLTRTIQITMTDMQIEQIAFIVSQRLKEDKKWLN